MSIQLRANQFIIKRIFHSHYSRPGPLFSASLFSLFSTDIPLAGPHPKYISSPTNLISHTHKKHPISPLGRLKTSVRVAHGRTTRVTTLCRNSFRKIATASARRHHHHHCPTEAGHFQVPIHDTDPNMNANVWRQSFFSTRPFKLLSHLWQDLSDDSQLSKSFNPLPRPHLARGHICPHHLLRVQRESALASSILNSHSQKSPEFWIMGPNRSSQHSSHLIPNICYIKTAPDVLISDLIPQPDPFIYIYSI